jgi:hypothetical protein
MPSEPGETIVVRTAGLVWIVFRKSVTDDELLKPGEEALAKAGTSPTMRGPGRRNVRESSISENHLDVDVAARRDC